MKNNFTNWEFRVLNGVESEIQKILNQWRHEYELIIIHIQFWENGLAVLLVRRRLS